MRSVLLVTFIRGGVRSLRSGPPETAVTSDELIYYLGAAQALRALWVKAGCR